MTSLVKFPAPYFFGGKTHAAPIVWEALGDVPHYVEPFCGSCAVLLRRPHPCNRPYYSETVNDADGLLVNALRSLRTHPDATAEAASVQVAEADLMAIHLYLLRWAAENNLERLMADPEWCDPLAGGRWLWGVSCWIGGQWCSGDGPWVVGADGKVTKRQDREPGVSRQLPHLGNDGQGVNRPQGREPGVSRRRPQLTGNGQGVNRPQGREPGVSRKRPHLADDGQGVNRPQGREPGVAPGTPERPWEEDDFHPMTMPELRRWFAFLSARLRHVRILNGDWKRAVTTGASLSLPVRQGKGPCGVFLDPPYADTAGRAEGLYRVDSEQVAHDVREWCLKRGKDERYRIVLAGFEGEHGTALADAGWREVEWFTAGHLRGGMGNLGEADEDGERHQQHRERLFLSEHCLRERSLFDGIS